VETLLINSRELAENDTVAKIVRNAEALFIAGGDQWNYTRYWMGTKLNDAINYLINKKKAPVGGTSAGLAIMGQYFFDAKNGGITSDTALTNPFHPKMSVNTGFLKTKWLTNFITDSHYSERERQGRHMVMLAQIKHQKNNNAYGLGIDEATAVAIDHQGSMKVFGKEKAWFLRAGKQKPEMLQAQTPVTWNQMNKAVAVFTIKGSQDGNKGGNIQKLNKFFTSSQSYFWVENGVLKNNLQ
jgi:cyanophycinase